jgi:hypothetical protein
VKAFVYCASVHVLNTVFAALPSFALMDKIGCGKLSAPRARLAKNRKLENVPAVTLWKFIQSINFIAFAGHCI